ncbi:XRE family transcriptional regulator [Alicyclobacillaceae bacterium I2511]|nr:XRE family transcriptional regulator [Alicyclobacillaceae bacterium I2511]
MTGLGARLKMHRQQQQLSVRELAKQAGVSVSYIYAIESGARGKNLDKLKQLAQALQIPLSQLWGDDTQ